MGLIGSTDHFAFTLVVEVKGSVEIRVLAPIGKKTLRLEANAIMQELKKN